MLHENASKPTLASKKRVIQISSPSTLKAKALFEILEEKGKLEPPFAKKFTGHSELFELRIRYQGQWRIIYAYITQNHITILFAFTKKTQKTPSQELAKAQHRLQEVKELL